MRTNLREVARAAGVNVATASRALRGLGMVTPETRLRVEKAAHRLNYVRDPHLAQSLSRIRQQDKPVFRETLAFLSDIGIPSPATSWLQAIFLAAKERAERLGYRLEAFSLEKSMAKQKRLGSTLAARGIRGVIVGPVTTWQPAVLHLEWEHLAVVQIGHTIWKPVLHRVEGEFYHGMAQAFRSLKQRGYRRFGLAVDRRYERMRRWVPLAALLLHREFSGCDSYATPMEKRWPWTRKGFEEWLGAEQPDVIITNGANVENWLAELGILVPQEIGVMRIDADASGKGSGMTPNYAAMSVGAVDMLTRLVEAGEFGLSSAPGLYLLSHGWHEGTTLRASQKTAAPLTVA